MGGNNPLNQQWLGQLEEKLVDVIAQANARLRPARVGTAVGSVDNVGGNRRDPRNGPIDRSVTVTRIEDAATGRVMGVIINHACHATTLSGENLLVTADYPGQARIVTAERLADRPVVMFLNGACGNINPGGYSAEASALGNFTPNRTFENAARIGRVLGEEAARVVTQIHTQGPVPVRGGNRTIRLPLKPMRSPADADEEVRQAEERLAGLRKTSAARETIDRARMDLIYAQTRARQARKYAGAPRHEVATEIQGIAVGETLFLGLPGEVFTEIGQALQKSQPFKHAAVVGYANDGTGYIPAVEALRGGDGYEVEVSVFEPAAIERFTAEAARLARELGTLPRGGSPT
jgi:hypothetical protein